MYRFFLGLGKPSNIFRSADERREGSAQYAKLWATPLQKKGNKKNQGAKPLGLVLLWFHLVSPGRLLLSIARFHLSRYPKDNKKNSMKKKLTSTQGSVFARASVGTLPPLQSYKLPLSSLTPCPLSRFQISPHSLRKK